LRKKGRIEKKILRIKVKIMDNVVPLNMKFEKNYNPR